ncbi:phytanoyl-CoA hydroxylase-interacting protein-like [Grus japonensis]|uniref:Phytanoyl-CoA hydroxylase-interacting protein-like n=1 Tax=Grus japonensis TaxID=30415 RepID=A0ABC9X3Z4_GRUJA
MEAPRLAHAMSSPTSPCEEVIKNLSLEAIQLCDRDVGIGSWDAEETYRKAEQQNFYEDVGTWRGQTGERSKKTGPEGTNRD